MTSDEQLILKQQRDVLNENRAFIVEHLDCDDVIDELIQARTLIGESAAQRLQLPGSARLSKKEKNEIIINELCTAGPNTLKKFCEILKSKEKLKFIAVTLEKCKKCFNVDSYS